MKTLLIAEKPSVARDISAVLGRFSRQEGFLENDQYVVSWAYGHITTLAEPKEYDSAFEKWSLENMPVMPDEFKLTVTERKQFSILKKLLKRKDLTNVINACDAGREGELIFRWIYKTAKSALPVKRLWLSETTPTAVIKALNSMKEGSQYDNLYAAAEARAISDWLVGINSTRAFTVKHGELLSIGRVQTPTLALIVQREREIRDFIPETYYQVAATFETESKERYQGVLIKDGKPGRYKEETIAKEHVELVTDSGTIVKASYTEKTEPPPMLFNLNDLQREANHVYGMTAAKVLEVAQSLYEKKLITYPRTDSRHLSESLSGTLNRRIETALRAVSLNSLPDFQSNLGPRYVDNAKITDHHAIIPTEMRANGYLSPVESNIYELICRRYLAIFFPPARYRVMEVTTGAGEMFFSKGRAVISYGWRRVYKFSAGEEDEAGGSGLPALNKGQMVKVVDVEVLKKETSPPVRYTDATLLSAMENAGRLVDDKELANTLKKVGGIGTPATRAAILERLIKVNYVQRQKKSLLPTAKGETLIDLVPEVLTNVDTTAEWEDGLHQIEHGEISAEEWLSGIKNLTRDIVEGVKGQTRTVNIIEEGRAIGKCPLCGKAVIETKKAYNCSGWRDGCKFVIWKVISGKRITAKQAQELINKGKTGVIKGFKSKSGNSFDAALVMGGDGKVKMNFGGDSRRQGLLDVAIAKVAGLLKR